jgi:hypothetical protein
VRLNLLKRTAIFKDSCTLITVSRSD